MAQRFGDGIVKVFSDVPAFRVRVKRDVMSPWVLVAHPLWDWADDSDESNLLGRARATSDEFGEPLCWDTFNLARRQVFVREAIRSEVLDSV